MSGWMKEMISETVASWTACDGTQFDALAKLLVRKHRARTPHVTHPNLKLEERHAYRKRRG